MILRIANGSQTLPLAPVQSHVEVFRPRERSPDDIAIWDLVRTGKLQGGQDMQPSPHPGFRMVHHVPGAERRPPNVYDSHVFTSTPDAIKLSSTRRPPTRHDVPNVPGAFLILDVFTPDECLQIVQAASSIGFERDEAAEGSARMKSSVSFAGTK